MYPETANSLVVAFSMVVAIIVFALAYRAMSMTPAARMARERAEQRRAINATRATIRATLQTTQPVYLDPRTTGSRTARSEHRATFSGGDINIIRNGHDLYRATAQALKARG
jgi:hypothetical protein